MAEATMQELAPRALERSSKRWVIWYLALTGIVLLLMMFFGLVMRIAQSGWIDLDPAIFYQLMTFHGTGMVGIASLGALAVMWYFLAQYVELRTGVLGFNMVLFLAGVVAMLIADFGGEFAGGWTFLYPLPAISQGTWENWAAGLHLIGLLVVGVGFLVVYLEIGRAIMARYGSLMRGLGWHVLFGNSKKDIPPPAVVASTMVVIVNVLGLIGAAVVLILNLVNLFWPVIVPDPLWMKNLTYFFGHIFANATIYQAVIIIYELLPRITRREYHTTKPFLAAWTVSTVLVVIIFPHHLFMDFVMPVWMMVLGQVFSYLNGLPVLVITGIAALTLVHRSGIRLDVLSGLLLLAMFGWMAGIIPAMVDATISANIVMHNTMWVPGHFHFYMLLGLLPLLFGMMYYLARGEDVTPRGGPLMAVLYMLLGLGFVSMFLVGGWASVPRRWAVHLAEWQIWDRIATVMAVGVMALASIFVLFFLSRLPQMLRSS